MAGKGFWGRWTRWCTLFVTVLSRFWRQLWHHHRIPNISDVIERDGARDPHAYVHPKILRTSNFWPLQLSGGRRAREGSRSKKKCRFFKVHTAQQMSCRDRGAGTATTCAGLGTIATASCGADITPLYFTWRAAWRAVNVLSSPSSFSMSVFELWRLSLPFLCCSSPKQTFSIIGFSLNYRNC